jgi:probable HAF family extracellular repeat protein
VVVGWAENASWDRRAFRWENNQMRNLGTLGGAASEAWSVSANGRVVVGAAQNASGQWRAFRWENNQMRNLGTLGGDWSEAFDVSADGSVVVGYAYNAAGQYRAFRWTASGGMEDLNTTYASLLTNGSVLSVAHAISPDGRYIVGYGRNAATGRYEAFLLDTRCTAHNGDVNRNGCVDDADLLAVLFAFGQTGSNLGRVDVNCDGVVDDADLLQVLFNLRQRVLIPPHPTLLIRRRGTARRAPPCAISPHAPRAGAFSRRSVDLTPIHRRLIAIHRRLIAVNRV